MSEPTGHIPVLLEETLAALRPQAGDIYVDLTLGLGGHAAAFANAVGPTGRIIGFDLDEANLVIARRRLTQCSSADWPFIDLVHGSYATVGEYLTQAEIQADLVLADLGFASTQVDDVQRGFGFRVDGPLDMRFDRTRSTTTAAMLVNECSVEELARIIGDYGEDPFAGRISRRIVEKRDAQPIETTAELAQIVVEAYGLRARKSRNHPATRTFQALRMAVNSELENLATLIDSIRTTVSAKFCQQEKRNAGPTGWIADGARIGFITFHSLEDRLVKRFISEMEAKNMVQRINRKPIRAGEDEIRSNPRARSAKLRAFVVIGSGGD